MKKILFLFILNLVYLTALQSHMYAQGTVTGFIFHKQNKQAIEFVNIALQKVSDSSVVLGTVTDKKGKFILENVAFGEYFITYSFIGYDKKKTSKFKINAQNHKVNLGNLDISETDQELNEVTVTGEKSSFNNAIDRKVFNVGKDIMSSTGSASDLLQNVPSVQVDIEGNVSLRGSENVLILINGKPSAMMGTNRAAVLQQMAANTIEKIEVITNPSAKYKPDGTSGILNIVLKKEKKNGINSTITICAGNDDRYNGNLLLNYNPGKFNFYVNYGFRQDDRMRFTSDVRHRIDSTLKILDYTSQTGNEHSRPLSNIVRAGFDYDLNDHNKFGISGNYNYRGLVKKGITNTTIEDVEHNIISSYDRKRYDPEFEKEHEMEARFEHSFQKEGHEIALDFSTSGEVEQEDNHYTNLYKIPDLQLSYDNTLIKQTREQSQIYVEYKNPLSDQTKFEAGYALELGSNDMDFYGEALDNESLKWLKDIQKTNLFKYNEALHALYTTLEHSFGKFGFLGGLRTEQAFIKSELINSGTTVPNDYFRLYPSLHLSYNINKSNELQVNYSHRVNRPEGDELNPFPEYRDPYNLRQGNPRLKPEDIHSIETGYQFNNEYITFLSTLYYRYTYNGMTSITKYLNDSILLTTQENMSKSQSTGLESVLSASIWNFLSINFNSNLFVNQIDASNLGYSNKKSIYTWHGSLSANFTLTKSTLLQLRTNYTSARLTPQGERRPNFVVNSGLRQDFFKKKASCIFTVSDLFNTLRDENILNTNELYQKIVRKRSPRIFYLSFTYHFGKLSKKSKDNTMKYDEQI